MITPLIFATLGIFALAFIGYLLSATRAKGGDLDQLAAQLRPVDVEAFRNLIDHREERFLRASLPPFEFWRIHRERMLAASEYVLGAARNAGILIQLAETAVQDSDPAVAAAAANLLENASSVRLYAFQAVPRFYVSMLCPVFSHSPGSFAERYAAMSRQMVTLGCLRPLTKGVAVSG